MDRGWPSQELEHYLKWSKPEKQVWLLPSLAMLANACLAPQKHQSRGWSYGEGTTSTDTDPLGEGEQQEEKREEKAQAAQHLTPSWPQAAQGLPCQAVRMPSCAPCQWEQAASLALACTSTCSHVAHLLLPFQVTSSSCGSNGMLLPSFSAGLT